MDMVCIYCGESTKVVNSRHQKRSNEVWRRRECLVCNTVFTTYEATELTKSVVVQYNQQRLDPFERDKLLVSIYESCRHQPKAITNATALTQTIINKLLALASNGIIQRDAIVAVCSETLEHYDGTAATFYAAYHKP